MSVAELIKFLERVDGNKIIIIGAYDCGYSEFTSSMIIEEPTEADRFYYGEIDFIKIDLDK